MPLDSGVQRMGGQKTSTLRGKIWKKGLHTQGPSGQKRYRSEEKKMESSKEILEKIFNMRRTRDQRTKRSRI